MSPRFVLVSVFWKHECHHIQSQQRQWESRTCLDNRHVVRRQKRNKGNENFSVRKLFYCTDKSASRLQTTRMRGFALSRHGLVALTPCPSGQWIRGFLSTESAQPLAKGRSFSTPLSSHNHTGLWWVPVDRSWLHLLYLMEQLTGSIPGTESVLKGW